mmetsp:Transcript_32094/g.70213  ORF Transcript_32094/g.70213 Transcript_32094/m.70213 type:complete len:266 (+) Transcript_32094:606-1403(+)
MFPQIDRVSVRGIENEVASATPITDQYLASLPDTGSEIPPAHLFCGAVEIFLHWPQTDSVAARCEDFSHDLIHLSRLGHVCHDRGDDALRHDVIRQAGSLDEVSRPVVSEFSGEPHRITLFSDSRAPDVQYEEHCCHCLAVSQHGVRLLFEILLRGDNDGVVLLYRQRLQVSSVRRIPYPVNDPDVRQRHLQVETALLEPDFPLDLRDRRDHGERRTIVHCSLQFEDHVPEIFLPAANQDVLGQASLWQRRRPMSAIRVTEMRRL